MAAFATPLGQVQVDRVAGEQVRKLASVSVLEQVHAQEHSLEVHLSFRYGADRKTFIVISSDLSHYQCHQAAHLLDSAISQAIGYEQACGRNPVNGLL
jgi:predicted class III extradiol MEMO1 family dioxygenase